MLKAPEVSGVGVLRYDWDAIANLVGVLGSDFDAKLSRAVVETDLPTIALALAIGSGKSVDDIMRLSPPIGPASRAMLAALNVAFHGTQEAPQVAEKNPPKNPPVWRTLWGMLKRQHSAPA